MAASRSPATAAAVVLLRRRVTGGLPPRRLYFVSAASTASVSAASSPPVHWASPLATKALGRSWGSPGGGGGRLRQAAARAASSALSSSSSSVTPSSSSSSSSASGSARRRPGFTYVSPTDQAEDVASPAAVAAALADASLPAMSQDGGSQAEFEVFWAANARPRRLEGGWVERLAHPQINCEPYWYNELTGELSWQLPPTSSSSSSSIASTSDEGGEALSGTGLAWELSVPELKEALAYGREAELALDYPELARRAVAEYEAFEPRVLSWHDFQHLTFWFFGGLKRRDREPSAKAAASSGGVPGSSAGVTGGFFMPGSGSHTGLFAPRPFFEESAKLIEARLGRMHPIQLCYFVWTFVRAEVVLPEFLAAVGDHFVAGRLPMCDRCALGTMVWNYGKLGIRHDRLFEASAEELARPNRVRSLAPRNYQNSLLAFGWRRHQHRRCLSRLAQGLRRLLDGHRPPGPKLDRKLLFSYTCKNGSEVKADSFRISSLAVILGAIRGMGLPPPIAVELLGSMLDYVRRSVEESPRMMREPGDACRFLIMFVRFLAEHPEVRGRHLLDPVNLDYALLCEGAASGTRERLRTALGNLGISLPSGESAL